MNNEGLKKLSPNDLSVLKYYKEGNELCGFEPDNTWDSLVSNGYLDGDLELTRKAWDFIKSYQNWDSVQSYSNKTKITVKPCFSNNNTSNELDKTESK